MAAVDAQLMADQQHLSAAFAYRWFSRRLLPERHGQRCRIIGYELRMKTGASVYGAWRGLTVQFEDGTTIAAERGMVKTVSGFRAAKDANRVQQGPGKRRGDDE